MAFPITANPVEGGRAWLADSQDRSSGSIIRILYQVEAEANDGYEFDHWHLVKRDRGGSYSPEQTLEKDDASNPFPTSISYSSWLIDEDWQALPGYKDCYTYVVSAEAIFKETSKKYTITTNCSPDGSATTGGDGQYDEGASCTITTAERTARYEFEYWESEGVEVSRNKTYTFTVTKDQMFTAHYKYLNGADLYYTIPLH